MTPLHVLIAELISRDRNCPFGYGLYVCQAETPKHRFYAERLAAISRRSEFKVVPQVVPKGLLRHWRWMRQLASIRKRFAAQFEDVAIQELLVPTTVDKGILALVTGLKPATLTTLDDGFVNIDPSPAADFLHTRWRQRMMLRLAGIDWWPERLRERSERHYTIYSQPNAVKKAQRLVLGSGGAAAPSAETPGPSGGEMAIFLGPYPEVEPDILAAFERAAQRLQPVGYLPHPRDAAGLIPSVPRIDSPMVAEDYIAQLLRDSRASCLRVYGFSSSGVVNLAAIEGVKAFNFIRQGRPPSPSDKMMESMGVSIVEF